VARAVSVGGCALIAAFVAASCGTRADGGEHGSSSAPDIVLVSIDSLRFDHLGCYGYPQPTTPNIDRIAAQGVRCASAVSTTSWTLPAHAALMTGLFDSTHGVVDNGLRLSDREPTLAAVLRENGYQTAGFFGGPYLHAAFGFGHGFEHYENCSDDAASAARDARAEDSAPSSADLERSHRHRTGPRTLDAVSRWLAHEADERPMFLFVHLWDVHYDYDPPHEYVEMFDPGYAGTLDASDLMHNPAINDHMAPRDLQHLIALYDGAIRFTDEILGKVLSAIEARGRMQNTLLVITADHGEEFFEHGDKGHQQTLFDEVVHVPLVVRWPERLPAGPIVRDQVRLVDVMPTLLACADAEDRPPMEGRDVTPLLRGEPMLSAPALCELLVGKNDVRALRTNAFKVVDWKDVPATFGYDLSHDPNEQRPLRGGSSVAAAGRELEAQLESAAEFKRSHGLGATPIEAPHAVEHSLRTLGYIGDDARSLSPKPR
jgi:arylsulfatase A-like enzyme